jgi:hypothetical protein
MSTGISAEQDNRATRDEDVLLQPVYHDAYQAIVQPDRIVRISRYLLEEWATSLGPKRFWLVVALRQRCYLNNDRDWCRCKLSRLARDAGVSRRWLCDLLQDPTDLIYRFILDRNPRKRRFSQSAGRSVSADSYYQVAGDDPLTPHHQSGLCQILLSAKQDGHRQVTEALQALLEMPFDSLRAQLDEYGGQVQLDVWLPTVRDVIQHTYGTVVAQQEHIALLCSQLQSHITQPSLSVLITWYFRDKWLPLLKPALALMIVYLRAQCFYNPKTKELRDTCVADWAGISRLLGVSDRQVRRLRRHPQLGQFLHSVENASQECTTKVQVEMHREPLVPEDQARLQAKVTQDGSYRIALETGQMAVLAQSEAPEPAGHFCTPGTPAAGQRYAQNGHFCTSGIDPDGHFCTSGGHFRTPGDGHPGHFCTSGGRFCTQTRQALQGLFDASTGSSTAQPAAADPAQGVGAGSSVCDAAAALPPKWLTVLDQARNNRDRVSVLARMAVDLGLADDVQTIDRRQLGRLMKEQAQSAQKGAYRLACAMRAMTHERIPAATAISAKTAALVAAVPVTQDCPMPSPIAAQAGRRITVRAIAVQAGPNDGSPEATTGSSDPPASTVNQEAAEDGLGALLDRLNIQGSNRVRIEATSSYADALAWTLYTATQANLNQNPQGFIVRRLIGGEPPPETYRAFAALPLQAISRFRTAVRRGRLEPDDAPEVQAHLFEQWADRFPWRHSARDDGLVPLLGPVEPMPVADVPVEDVSPVGDETVDQESEEDTFTLPGTDLDGSHVWRQALQELEMQMTRATFSQWLRGTWVGLSSKGGLVVYARDGYAVDWLRARLCPPIQRTVNGIVGREVPIEFEAKPDDRGGTSL